MEPTPATMLLITTVVDLVTRASNGAGDGVSALVRERLAGTADGRAALAGMAGKHAHPASADAHGGTSQAPQAWGRVVLQREIAADASCTAALARAVVGEPSAGPPPPLVSRPARTRPGKRGLRPGGGRWPSG